MSRRPPMAHRPSEPSIASEAIEVIAFVAVLLLVIVGMCMVDPAVYR
jgi:hypothetical protein